MMGMKAAAPAALIAVACSTAAAQDIGGRYQAEGTLPGGKSYSETAEIKMMPDKTCRISWSGGVPGICMLDGTRFMVGYIVHGVAALGVYEVAPDGSIEGVFIDKYHGQGFGKEKLTPIR